ncbi:MAG: arylesterase [Qingshengfaniella sp.]
MPLSVAAQPIIAALGDSLTQGYGLPQDEGFVPTLETWLHARGETAMILNAGVSGDTTAGGVSRIDWTLTDDVDGLIVTLGGNDLLRGLAPETSRANLAAILDTAQAKGVPVLLVGMQAPANYGPDYQTTFDAIYPDLAAVYGVLLAPSFLQPLINATGSEDEARRLYLQADGIHPNAEGVRVIVDALGPDVQRLIAAIGPE